tara:strand:- start:603 stop:770 length:168 start_codon:yes stop_codon:yes gene_type:complete
MKKYVVIASWCSTDSMVYGLFDSYEEAKKFIDNYKWDEYDKNNELRLEVDYLRNY